MVWELMLAFTLLAIFSHEFLAYQPWIAWKVSSVLGPLTIENGFKQNVGETRCLGVYIYIETYDFFFGVNMALHLLKCVRSESAGGAAYQAGSVSENNPPRENQQRFIGEKWWWSNLCHNVVSDGESWSYFFGSNLQTIEPLLVLHVVAVQKAFVAGVAGYGCKELWHVMGKDCEGLRR